jgi:hypothetical protein
MNKRRIKMARTMQKKTVTVAEEVQPVEEKIIEEKKVKKEFSQSDGIQCHSVVQGGLYFVGDKTGMLYSFSDYGDITDIEYRDLVAAIRTKSGYVFNPYFIVDDEDFIAEFPALKKFYEDQISVKDLKNILNMPVDEMIDAIKKLPPTAIDSLKKIAATQVGNGKLDSVKKIKALDELFGTDLNLIGELFSEQ